MIAFNYIDTFVFVILTAFVLYSLDAVDFKKMLKPTKPRQAFLFYMLSAFAISALVFTFYVYFKSLMFGMNY